jgi:hypothetical protein
MGNKLPWVELQVGFNGCVHFMKCKICSSIKQKDKLLAPKWDSFKKHDGCKSPLSLVVWVIYFQKYPWVVPLGTTLPKP